MNDRVASPHFVIEHVPELLGNMFTTWGQAAGDFSSRESGIKVILERDPKTPIRVIKHLSE
jgi:hypothetical protein